MMMNEKTLSCDYCGNGFKESQGVTWDILTNYCDSCLEKQIRTVAEIRVEVKRMMSLAVQYDQSGSYVLNQLLNFIDGGKVINQSGDNVTTLKRREK